MPIWRDGKYKRSLFIDWRLCDRLRRKLLPTIDYLLDTNVHNLPKMIPGPVLQEAFKIAVRRPFRVVPFLDPGPWGGHWMKRMFDLPKAVPNYAWCFDRVPEENTILLGFDEVRVENPAADLVFSHPEELLGQHVFEEFGAEFPSGSTFSTRRRWQSFTPGPSAHGVHASQLRTFVHPG
jgi:hypothetical protein